MEAQSYALRELLEFRRVELFPEFGLACEDDAQHLFLVRLDVREHADLLEHLERQVLRLVDDKYHFLVIRVLLDQEHVEHIEQFDFALLERPEAEFR